MSRSKEAKWRPIKHNFTVGRRGYKIKKIVFHHAVSLASLFGYFGEDDTNVSSHYWAGPKTNEQYVDEANMAWTNGVLKSNGESITIETAGDWRFGYRDEDTFNNLVNLVRDIRERHPGISKSIHRLENGGRTECPGDLPVDEIWSKSDPAKAKLVRRKDIVDKKIRITKDTNVWDMDFVKHTSAKTKGALAEGVLVDVAGIYEHPSGSIYYLSSYAWNKGLNQGINVKDAEDYTAPVKTVSKAKDEVFEDAGPGMLPPLPVDANGEDLNKLLLLIRWLENLIRSLQNGK